MRQEKYVTLLDANLLLKFGFFNDFPIIQLRE